MPLTSPTTTTPGALMNSPSPPPSKRPRNVELPDAVQHPRLWFADGNVVLEAERTRFKVFRGVLALHSIVFANLFHDAQPTATEVVDGCPLVHLADSAVDVEIMLNALYAAGKYHKNEDRMTVATLGAFLRMGTKYEIDHLREAAVARLEHEYPHTYEDFVASLSRRGNDFPPEKLEDYVGAVVDLINIAHEHGVHSALPLLLYFAHGLSVKDMACGVEREGLGVYGRAILGPESLRLLAIGRQTLVEHQASRLGRWVDKAVDRCVTPQQCAARKQMVMRSLYIPHYVPITLLPWDDAWNEGLCRVCQPAARRSHDNSRNQTWRQLPSLLGLADWDDLAATGDETQIL